MTIESICNQALDLIGYKRHIGSVYDGTPAARVALNAFVEVRDEVLAVQPWSFARAREQLVALGDSISQPLGLYVYERPDVAITILDMYPADYMLLHPEPTRWIEAYIENDRRLAASFTNAMAVMTIRIVNPDDWPPDFTLAMIQSLARRFAPLVGGPPKEGDEKR